MTEEERIKPPNWLENLEKQREKRVQRRLGHEAGAGALCLICGDKCPGLDLHFWRKICKNCKCGKECHNIEDDDVYGFAQFQLLGTKPVKSKGFILPSRSAPMNLEWTPQGAKDVVERYLDEMPTDLLPVSGSEAAKMRRKRLQTQLPAHDIDASLCDELTPAEMQQLDEYVSHIRQHCVGQGRVIELPINVASHHVMSEPNVQLLSQQIPKHLASSEMVALQPSALADTLSNLKLRPHAGAVSNCAEIQHNEVPKHFATAEMVALQPGMLAEGLKPHEISPNANSSQLLYNVDTISGNVNVSNSEPVNLVPSSMSNNMSRLRSDVVNSNVSVPKCHGCNDELSGGAVVVSVERTNAKWHPQCFKCHKCGELLVDLLYFYHEASGQVYCGRDFAKIKGIPRCSACDELIFTREYCLAEESTFHVKHFCCWECDNPLAGQQYLMENNQPMCLPCFEIVSADKCRGCGDIIKPHEQGVSLQGLHWHATPECFACKQCHKNLLKAKMLLKDEHVFCSGACIALSNCNDT